MIVKILSENKNELIVRIQSLTKGEYLIWITSNMYGNLLRINYNRSKSSVFKNKKIRTWKEYLS